VEILNNNARILQAEHLLTQRDDLDDMEATVAANPLVPICRTFALLPLLKWQPCPAIVNVSSGQAFASLATHRQLRRSDVLALIRRTILRGIQVSPTREVAVEDAVWQGFGKGNKGAGWGVCQGRAQDVR
jgi:NAD(P)-dependent dehydrogenase (short-subunit alcohol dehydrogenase family)